MSNVNRQFSSKITRWYLTNKRDLPWRNTTDAYLIWLSEIILQQTRVEQGLPYYRRFTEVFPDIKQLAQAKESEVLKLWQGLGYYSRARNLHAAAKAVYNNHSGKFPASYDQLRKLKGIGDYTAAAIASFAFDLPHAVVDGNVYRLLSRCFNISTPIDTTAGKHRFFQLAQQLLDVKNAALHNQAIMELGAVICKPKNPLCLQCPLNSSCIAFEKNTMEQLPVKSKKVKVTNRYFYYLLIKCNNHFIIEKRTGNDIWKNLFQLPLIEKNNHAAGEKIFSSAAFRQLINGQKFTVQKISAPVLHKLSHQNLHTVFITIKVNNRKLKTGKNREWITPLQLKDLALPKLIETFLQRALK